MSSFGCGGKTPSIVPVRGKVLLNGQPLTTGRVLTQPSAGRGANGIIKSDGTFELSTLGDRDGASPGTHKVAVVAYQSVGAGPEAGPGNLLVPERYTNPESSGLTIEVTADGENAPVLELTSS
jgi:hypothetical protein